MAGRFVDYHREFATAIGAMPVGAAMHFWDAVNAASIPSLEKGSEIPPRDETASTMTAASTACAASTMGSRGFVTPVDVSLWITATAFGRVFRASRRAGTSGPAPQGDATNSAFTRCVSRTSRTRSPKKPFDTTTTRSPGRRKVYAIASRAACPGPAIGNTWATGADQRYRSISPDSGWAFTHASPYCGRAGFENSSRTRGGSGTGPGISRNPGSIGPHQRWVRIYFNLSRHAVSRNGRARSIPDSVLGHAEHGFRLGQVPRGDEPRDPLATL